MDELISEFVEETTESMAVLDNQIITLEQNPEDYELLGNIFRLIHTVKGTCGFLGLPRLESVAHAGENVLGKIRDKELPVTPEAVSLVLEAFDTIKTLIEHLQEHGAEPEGDDTDLIQRLNVHAGMGEDGGRADFENALEAIEAAEKEEAAKENAEDTQSDTSDDTAKDDTAKDDTKEAIEPEVEEETEESTPENAIEAIETPAAAEPKPEQKAKAVEAGLKAAEKAKETAKAPKPAGGGGNQSIRVSLDVLEDLMQMVSELVLTRNQLTQLSRKSTDSNFNTSIQRLNHITTELQEGVMKTRMQPISNAWAKFPRLVRDLSMELKKDVELNMSGEETELDRQLLEYIKDPLTHMVRNSVDHGLELPDEREEAGKDRTGNVYLSAYHEGGHIIIEIRDDGRGLNTEKLAKKIISNGLASEEDVARMSDSQIMQHIFHPGFSTAEQVTNISGRGVGMDVVRSNIEKIGGAIELSSELGHGTRLRIKIPLTLAIVSILIVESCDQRFAIPQINVVEMVYASSKSDHKIEMINHSPVMRLRDKLLPLIALGDIMELQDKDYTLKTEGTYVVICNVGDYDFGIVVDKVYDSEEIVVKPLSPLLAHLDVFSGCTILGDGSVILIADPNGLARRTGDVHTNANQQKQEAQEKELYSKKEISFLLFSTGEKTPKAVPLDLVSRLEEIPQEKLEHSGSTKLVQYRDQLMRLITLTDDMPANDEGFYEVIVFNYEGNLVGLVVHEILDISRNRLDVKMSSNDPRYVGSMVMRGVTTDIIDTGKLLSDAIGELLDRKDSNFDDLQEGRLILLVDDSAFFRNLNAPYLSSRGFEVLTAEGPEEALELLKNTKTNVELIISDIEMPNINGIEFARICKKDPRYKDIPMIAYTSNMSAEFVKNGLEAGFLAYVSKTDRDGLAREVEQALQGHAQTTELEAL